MSMEVKRGEIWIANLGFPRGSEQRGTRPVLILQNDVGNLHSPTVIVAAISRTKRVGFPTHVPITAEESGLFGDSMILLEQIRTVDKSALSFKIGPISESLMLRVEYALMKSLGLIPIGDEV